MKMNDYKFIENIKELASEILTESQESNSDNTKIMAKAMCIMTLCDVVETDKEQPKVGYREPLMPYATTDNSKVEIDIPSFERAIKEQQGD